MLEIKIKIEAPELTGAITHLADALLAHAAHTIQGTNNGVVLPEILPYVPEATDPETTTELKPENTETISPSAARKQEIKDQLDRMGVEYPKTGKLALYERLLQEASSPKPEPQPEASEPQPEASEPQPEASEPEPEGFEYAKVHALARLAVAAHPDKAAFMRKLLDEEAGEGIGLQQACDTKPDCIPPIVKKLEEVSGSKYSEM